MTFLIVYDRSHSRIVSLKSYPDELVETALAERLDYEFAHKDEPSIEVVTITSASEEQLRKTHSRYFEGTGELLESFKNAEAAAADAA